MTAARLEHAATLQASCAVRMPFPTPQSSRKRMVWGLRPRHPLTPSLLSNAHLHAIGFVLRSMCTATNAIALRARLEQCGYLRVLAVRVSELLKLVSVRETNAAWLLAVLCGNHLADVLLAFLVDVEYTLRPSGSSVATRLAPRSPSRHRLDHALDEGDLLFAQGVLGVKLSVHLVHRAAPVDVGGSGEVLQGDETELVLSDVLSQQYGGK